MRCVLLVVAWSLCVPLAQAAGLAGTFVTDAPGGRIVAKISIQGTRLTGIIDVAGSSTINLAGGVTGNYASGTATSNDGVGAFEAAVEGDTLQLTLSQKAGPNQQAATLPLVFQRASSDVAAQPRSETPAQGAKPSPQGGGGDQRLIGSWVSQNLVTSGAASMASEQFLVFGADGSYSYGKGRAVAGGADWSHDAGAGGETERGSWRAQAGLLYLLDQNGQWTRVGKYGLTEDGRTMMITYDRGGKKLWSRR